MRTYKEHDTNVVHKGKWHGPWVGRSVSVTGCSLNIPSYWITCTKHVTCLGCLADDGPAGE